jgi:DNA mismatch repair protein MutH
MSDEHRVKIQNSNVLRALIDHVEGKREMSATQVTAGLGLLRKVLPDLASVEHSGGVETTFVALVPDIADNSETWQRAHSPSLSSSGDLSGRKPH